MRLLGFGRSVVVASAVFTASVGLFALQKETENVDKALPFPQKGTLKLRNFSGDVTITGTSSRDVVIKAVRRAERDQLEHIKLDIQTSGSTVTIDANKRDSGWDGHENNVVDTTFEIQVPASAMLDVYGFSSDLNVRGVTGGLNLETFSGAIDVDLSAAGASPEVNAKTFSGRIQAKLAENAKGDVKFDSFSGSLDSDVPLSQKSTNRKSTNGALPGGAGKPLVFKTFSGSLRLVK